MAIKMILTRIETGKEGTFGRITIDNDREGVLSSFTTAELPWKENRTDISCIPAGVYQCLVATSPKYGLCPHIFDVPGRSNILIHYGNWAGSVEDGWYSNSEGCILVGIGFSEASPKSGFRSQRMVTSSRKALGEMLSILEDGGVTKGDMFELEVKDSE